MVARCTILVIVGGNSAATGRQLIAWLSCQHGALQSLFHLEHVAPWIRAVCDCSCLLDATALFSTGTNAMSWEFHAAAMGVS